MKKTLLLGAFFLLIKQSTFAQWTDNSGTALPLSLAPDFQSFIYTTADSLGNTYYLWTDFRTKKGDLYAQKLDARGIPQCG